jgi:hypothetical protein
MLGYDDRTRVDTQCEKQSIQSPKQLPYSTTLVLVGPAGVADAEHLDQPTGVSVSTTIEQLAGVAHAMHALLVKRADQLAGDIDGSADVTE